MKRLFALWILFGLLFTGCSAGNKSFGVAKRLGEGRHQIANVEELNNGLFQVWFFGDDDYAYCTLDKSFAEMARAIKNDPGPNDGIALYKYRDFLDSDPEWAQDSGGYQFYYTCGISGTYKSKLMEIKPLRPLLKEVGSR